MTTSTTRQNQVQQKLNYELAVRRALQGTPVAILMAGADEAIDRIVQRELDAINRELTEALEQ